MFSVKITPVTINHQITPFVKSLYDYYNRENEIHQVSDGCYRRKYNNPNTENTSEFYVPKVSMSKRLEAALAELQEPALVEKTFYTLLHADINSLIGEELSEAELKYLIEGGNNINHSINPVVEIIGLLDNVMKSEDLPQHCAIISVLYGDIVLGSISVTFDARTTFCSESVAYMIGIRKSTVLLAAQYFFIKKNISNDLTTFHLTDYLVPAVESFAKQHGATYIIVQPLDIMLKILSKYFGFIFQKKNTMKNEYTPPVLMMTAEWECIMYKKIK